MAIGWWFIVILLSYSLPLFPHFAHIAASYIIINLLEILVVKIFIDGRGGGGMKTVK